MNPNLTIWFQGHQKPIRAGFYERKYVDPAKHFINHSSSPKAFWNGHRWHWPSMSGKLSPCYSQPNRDPHSFVWRGLAQPPEQP